MRLLPRREAIGDPGCVIMYRWELVNFGPRIGKLMLHHFMPGRDDSHPHDHPSAFWTFVLRGGYDDLVACSRCGGTKVVWARVVGRVTCHGCGGAGLVLGEEMRAGMLRHRPSEHMHVTKIGPDGAWTLCWMGPKRRAWGFQVGRMWVPWKQYVQAHGYGERC